MKNYQNKFQPNFGLSLIIENPFELLSLGGYKNFEVTFIFNNIK